MRNHLFAPKLFYFCWFAALGAFSPFVALYYREAGLDLTQIGLLIALPGLLQLVAAPLWGLLADGLRLHRTLLPLALLGTLVPVLLIGRSDTFGVLLALVAVLALCSAPVTPLADSATLALLGSARARYGALRVWGAVGWVVSTWVFGALIGRYGLGIAFPGYLVLGAFAAAASMLLPRASLPQVELRTGLGVLLRDVRWARFLGCLLLIGCASALIHGFLSLYLQDLGANGEQIGRAIALGGLSELPVMALAPLVLRRWGARPLLVASGLLFALRLLIYVVAPTPGWALAAQLLHGPCFAALWAGGVDEAQRLAPPGLETTAQSLLGTVFFGVASALASAGGGWIYQELGYGVLFGVGAGAALLGGLGLLVQLPERGVVPVRRTS